MFCLDERSIDNIFNAFEYIEKWAEEHPLVTMRDKYKEVFGVEPQRDNNFVCPRHAGFYDTECGDCACEDCKEEFWQSEYKPPKKESE